MSIDSALLHKLAVMASLSFTPEEEETMLQDLNQIADWVGQLCASPTEGVEPLINMSPEVNVLRDDTPEPGLEHEQALCNAPERDTNYFRVPPVKPIQS